MSSLTREPSGKVLGSISARGTTGAALPSSGQGFDFAIAGLGFNFGIRDELPYSRETAPFKKEQFDNAPVVGEQSLDGWWLRSQMSFHKGAGVKFYDTLAGEEVLDRFQDSEGIDPTEPGEVSLSHATASYNSSYVRMLADGPAARSEDLAGVTNAGGAVLIDGTTTTSLTPATAGTVTAVARGGEDVYFATTGGIEKVPNSGTSLTSLWTASVPLHRVWWAKNRLFAVDTAGDFWAVSTDGGALDAANRVWRSQLKPTTGRAWSMVDTPSAVLAAQAHNIFAISLDPDGAVPEITSGVVAAQLPNDEYINDIAYTLGYLIISTTKGVRLAVVQGAEVVFGPLVVKGTAGTAAVRGTTAHVGFLDEDGRRGIVALDLEQTVVDLVCAWSFERSITGTMTPYAFVSLVGDLYVATDTGLQKESATTLIATGYLLTGFQRFGTLEPKGFRNVRVRIGGTGGSIAISRITKGGGEVPLYTVGVTGVFEDEITLGMPDPQEYVALKFTLSRDPVDTTKAPLLQGYQLRAVPAPRRQRMLTIPLMCFDVERTHNGVDQGRDGWAWYRLSNLEARERDGAVYSYQDFRTGEAGSAYIEQVRFINRTPPSGRTSGFGGYLVVTLRVVS